MVEKFTPKPVLFFALVFLTALQIGLSYLPLGDGNLIAGILLATAQAILVGLFFMGLKDEKRLVQAAALVPLILFVVLNAAVVWDVVYFTH